MRLLAAGAAMLGLVVLAPVPVDAAEDTLPRLLTLQEPSDSERGDAPVILRGSGSAPTAAPASASGPGWQIAAGERLWVLDPATQDLRTCAARNTTQVGLRVIRCLSRPAGRYARTFGPAFQP